MKNKKIEICFQIVDQANWNELGNIVQALESVYTEQGLTDVDIFVFTDNCAAECAFFHWHVHESDTVCIDCVSGSF